MKNNSEWYNSSNFIMKNQLKVIKYMTFLKKLGIICISYYYFLEEAVKQFC